MFGPSLFAGAVKLPQSNWRRPLAVKLQHLQTAMYVSMTHVTV